MILPNNSFATSPFQKCLVFSNLFFGIIPPKAIPMPLNSLHSDYMSLPTISKC